VHGLVDTHRRREPRAARYGLIVTTSLAATTRVRNMAMRAVLPDDPELPSDQPDPSCTTLEATGTRQRALCESGELSSNPPADLPPKRLVR
jgi:hypothetical protein